MGRGQVAHYAKIVVRLEDQIEQVLGPYVVLRERPGQHSGVLRAGHNLVVLHSVVNIQQKAIINVASIGERPANQRQRIYVEIFDESFALIANQVEEILACAE